MPSTPETEFTKEERAEAFAKAVTELWLEFSTENDNRPPSNARYLIGCLREALIQRLT